MRNPILQLLSATNKQNQNNMINRLRDIMSTGNPTAIFNNMMNTNPQFRDFVEKNKNKSIEEIAMEYDLDMSILNYFK